MTILSDMLRSKLYEPGTTQYKDSYGQLHRLDGPAVMFDDGSEVWCKNNQIHRDGGPAVILSSGVTEWYQNGKYHREDGPAIEYPDGDYFWYKEGKIHREDGPAVQSNEKHFWFLGNVGLTFNEFCDKIKISDEDKMMLRMKYSEIIP